MNLTHKKIACLIVVSTACALLLNACAPYQAHKGSAYYKQRGKASWYGPGFAGRKTANGERFNPSQLTAAHKKLPFNTTVRVTNLNNDKSVIVRINDRGPYAGRRIIDLSKAAAKRIGLIQSGVAMVEIETVSPATKGKSKTAKKVDRKIQKSSDGKTGILLAARGRVRKNGVAHLISVENKTGKPLPSEVREVAVEEAAVEEVAVEKAAPEPVAVEKTSGNNIEERFVVTTSTSPAKTAKALPDTPKSPPDTDVAGQDYSADQDDF